MVKEMKLNAKELFFYLLVEGLLADCSDTFYCDTLRIL